MGPSGYFYSCMGVKTQDTSILWVDGLSTRHPGIWGITVANRWELED